MDNLIKLPINTYKISPSTNRESRTWRALKNRDLVVLSVISLRGFKSLRQAVDRMKHLREAQRRTQPQEYDYEATSEALDFNQPLFNPRSK